MSQAMRSPSSIKGDWPAYRSLRADVPDGGAACGARETPVREQRHFAVERFITDDGLCRHQHFRHAAAARPLVADDDHVAGADAALGHGAIGILFMVENARGADKTALSLGASSILDDAAFRGDVALEHGDAAGFAGTGPGQYDILAAQAVIGKIA